MHNIDAQRGGDCVLLCQVSADYSSSPPKNRSKGLDGVILLDAGLTGGKRSLAVDAAITIINATTSNDRLGLVLVGEKTSMISELIMCTNPYKVALQNSIREIASAETTATNQSTEGIEIALGLLAKEARNGGHIFFVSDGRCVQNLKVPSRASPTSIHSIGIGGLTYTATLRHILQGDGSFLEFRSSSRDSPALINLIALLTSQTHPQPISTVRCRLTYPPEINIISIDNLREYTESEGQISLTLRLSKFPSLLTIENILPLDTQTFSIHAHVSPVITESDSASSAD
jgi:hypothetical protein